MVQAMDGKNQKVSQNMTEEFKTYPDRVADVDDIRVFGDKAAKIDDGDTFVATVDYVEGHKVVILTPKSAEVNVIEGNPSIKSNAARLLSSLKSSAELLERAEFETDDLGKSISLSILKDSINQTINEIETGD